MTHSRGTWTRKQRLGYAGDGRRIDQSRGDAQHERHDDRRLYLLPENEEFDEAQLERLIGVLEARLEKCRIVMHR